MLRRSVRTWEQALGASHPQLALSLKELAQLYHQQGKNLEAEPLLSFWLPFCR